MHPRDVSRQTPRPNLAPHMKEAFPGGAAKEIARAEGIATRTAKGYVMSGLVPRQRLARIASLLVGAIARRQAKLRRMRRELEEIAGDPRLGAHPAPARAA